MIGGHCQKLMVYPTKTVGVCGAVGVKKKKHWGKKFIVEGVFLGHGLGEKIFWGFFYMGGQFFSFSKFGFLGGKGLKKGIGFF